MDRVSTPPQSMAASKVASRTRTPAGVGRGRAVAVKDAWTPIEVEACSRMQRGHAVLKLKLGEHA